MCRVHAVFACKMDVKLTQTWGELKTKSKQSENNFFFYKDDYVLKNAKKDVAPLLDTGINGSPDDTDNSDDKGDNAN